MRATVWMFTALGAAGALGGGCFVELDDPAGVEADSLQGAAIIDDGGHPLMPPDFVRPPPPIGEPEPPEPPDAAPDEAGVACAQRLDEPCVACSAEGMPIARADDDRCAPPDCEGAFTHYRRLAAPGGGGLMCKRAWRESHLPRCLAAGVCRTEATLEYCNELREETVLEGIGPCRVMVGCEDDLPPREPLLRREGESCGAGFACDGAGQCVAQVNCNRLQHGEFCRTGRDEAHPLWCEHSVRRTFGPTNPQEVRNCDDFCRLSDLVCVGAWDVDFRQCDYDADDDLRCDEEHTDFVCRCAPR